MATVHRYGLVLLSALLIWACADDDEIVSPAEEGKTTPSLSSAHPGLPEGITPGSIDAEFADIARNVPGFGGLFIDEGIPTVYLVDPTQREAAQEAVTPLLLERDLLEDGSVTTLDIQVRQADYDFLQLAEWSHLVTDLLTFPGVLSLDIDESVNRVSFGVENMGLEAVLKRDLAKLGVPEKAVIIYEEEPTVPMTTLQDRVRRVLGGLRIDRPPGLENGCTLSFNTYSNGGYAFVTASHCSEVWWTPDSTLFYQPTVSGGNYIGFEFADPEPFQGGDCPTGEYCRYADANLSRYDSAGSANYGRIARTTYWKQWESGSIVIDSSRPHFYIRGEGRAPVMGQWLYKMGQRTGWTGGPVVKTCYKPDKYGGIQLVCQGRVAAHLGGGDSGSPVFSILPNGRDIKLYGILWGGSVLGFGFSRLSYFEDELGEDLPTAILKVTIIGPTEVQPHEVCEWEADVDGGIPPYSYKWYRDGDLVSTQYNYLTYDTGDSGTDWDLWVDVTDSGQIVNSDRITIYVDHEFEECSA
jgi:hypothetical protein